MTADKTPDNIATPPADTPFQFQLRSLFLAVIVLGVVIPIGIRFVRSARESARQMGCSNNLNQIGLALQSYHDTYNCFPAAWQVDRTGKPAHSWRTVILGLYFDKTNWLYRYSFSEPWNGPNNSKLVSGNHAVFRCPSDHGHKPEMTNYVAVVGPGTAWPGAGYSSVKNFTDGAQNTIMVVEITNSNIHWMEPRDLTVEEIKEWLDPKHKPTLFHSHTEGGVTGGLVVFADGHVEFLSHDTTIDRLKALVSRAGGDNSKENVATPEPGVQ